MREEREIRIVSRQEVGPGACWGQGRIFAWPVLTGIQTESQQPQKKCDLTEPMTEKTGRSECIQQRVVMATARTPPLPTRILANGSGPPYKMWEVGRGFTKST